MQLVILMVVLVMFGISGIITNSLVIRYSPTITEMCSHIFSLVVLTLQCKVTVILRIIGKSYFL